MIVIPATKERARGPYFWTTWIFWLTYVLFGFAGLANFQGTTTRLILQTVVKLWICIIGLPWLAFRTISPDRLPALHKAITGMMCAGALLAIYQFFDSQSMKFILVQEGRGAGLWENPNHCGIFLTITLFLSFIPEWKVSIVAWGIRALLIIAILMTLSRAAYLGIFVGSLFYALAYGKFSRFASAIFLTAMFGVGLVIFMQLVDQNVIPLENEKLRSRISSTLMLLQGDFTNVEKDLDRFHLWESAIDQVREEGNLVTGSGHGSMLFIKKTRHAPHNDYIQFFGDGGIVGLTAYLCFYGMLLRQAWRCQNPRLRSALGACALVFMTYGITADKFLALHATAPLMVLMAMWGYYGRTIPPDDKAQAFRTGLIRRSIVSSAIPT
ncbi:MAG: O-antigen ligase family protein [Pirellulales bacterium]